MYSRFPIQCECSYSRDRFNLAFARKAMEFLRPGKELVLEPSPRGLTLLAETEMALERPIAVLKDVYGDEVRVGPPTVRYHEGAQVEEPYMGLRIRCQSPHFERLKGDHECAGAVCRRHAVAAASVLGERAREPPLEGLTIGHRTADRPAATGRGGLQRIDGMVAPNRPPRPGGYPDRCPSHQC